MTTIFWAGDSTVKQNTILTWPQTGIGQMFDRFSDRTCVRMQNCAENGRSTKSFMDEGRLDAICREIRAGDFLFVQFGHNDEKADDPNRYTDPDGAFVSNLALFADAAKARGAVPVFITPVTRRGFADPKAVFRHDRWAAAMRKAAVQLDVALIDLTAMSEEWLIHSPQEKRDDWFMPDGTHLKPEGAMTFAALIAKGLNRLGGKYAELLDQDYRNSLKD